MQFTALFTTLALATSSAFAVTLKYDNLYDNRDGDLHTVACSDGSNGLVTRGFTTFGSLSAFPHVGGASAVEGWNSANCGSCFRLTYPQTGNSILFVAIDHAGDGFVSSQAAMDELTNGNAGQFGSIDVQSEQVDASQCGL
jgi:hypothetical protein